MHHPRLRDRIVGRSIEYANNSPIARIPAMTNSDRRPLTLQVEELVANPRETLSTVVSTRINAVRSKSDQCTDQRTARPNHVAGFQPKIRETTDAGGKAMGIKPSTVTTNHVAWHKGTK